MKTIELKTFSKYDEFIRKIYEESFPKKERIDFSILLNKKNKEFKLLAFINKQELIGFSYLIIADGCVYLMYLAVKEECRNKGFGSNIIKIINKRYKNKPIFVSVEKPDFKDCNKIRRIKFYQKNGFVLTDFQYDWLGTILIPMCKNNDNKQRLVDFLNKHIPDGKNYKDIKIKI